VLLDFTCGRDNPAISFLGAAIRDECGFDDDMRTIADVPGGSLLSRLTDHYMQIIANRAPIGFEAEFANPTGETICYRGILMPFSSDGDTIDFIYGVINWKNVGGTAHAIEELLELADAVAAETSAEAIPETVEEEPLAEPEVEFVEDEPVAEPEVEFEEEEPVEYAAPFAEPESYAIPDIERAEDADSPVDLVVAEDAALADRLWAARETAEAVKSSEGRTRASLYRALSLAYDFALAAQHNPNDYAELLEESGVKAQARAPMTPIVKLVFGVDYDKARLTEFAAALSFAQREQVGVGGFQELIERQSGGLKALVAAERQARRPDSRPDDRGEAARARLRSAEPISLFDVASDAEFAVIITRRGADGRHEPVAVIDDPAVIERAIRAA
jgi:hypothetical protein